MDKQKKTGTRRDETPKATDRVSKDNKDVESGEPVQLGKETPEAELRGRGGSGQTAGHQPPAK